MASWRERLFSWGTLGGERSLVWPPPGLFTYNGVQYPFGGMPQTTLGSKQEAPQPSFEGFAQGLYKSNPIVFSVMETRRLLFSEARFQYRQLRKGVLGDLFGTPELQILEEPWRGGSTRKLLSRAINDADLSGNWYGARRGGRIMRMRPDWVSIVLGSDLEPDDPGLALDAEVIGYLFHAGGYRSKADPLVLLPEEVAHWAPIPDPVANFRGMSWLAAVLSEIMSDAAMTEHRLRFFENGATVNGVVVYPPELTTEQFKQHVEAFKTAQQGVANAYRTVFLGGGSSYTPIGQDMQQIDFKVVQGAGETRIAAAGRVPPIMVGLSEGLGAATYSNYGQARRAFADLTMRPTWGDFAASVSSIVQVPADALLWYDDRHIPFLQEDVKDEADIQSTQAGSIRQLVDAGYKPETVVDAVTSGDLSRLVHSKLFSVQLQPPASEQPPPPTNGAAPLPIGASDE